MKVHLARLVELELIWAHRGPHGSYLYELAWEGGSGELRLSGLIDPGALGVQAAEKHIYDRNRSGSGANRPGAVGGRSAPG